MLLILLLYLTDLVIINCIYYSGGRDSGRGGGGRDGGRGGGRG